MYAHKPVRTFSQLALLLAMFTLAACSGEDLTKGPPTTTSTTTVTGGTTGGTTGGGTAATVRIGSVSNGTFIDGTLQITPSSLSANGTAAITANLVDANGDPVTTSTTINFSSPCVSNSMATFSNPTQTTLSGAATTNYLAQGCTGSDQITATINGTTQSAAGNITVASANAGSIQFVSVSNSLIALAGSGSTSGLPENSDVEFIVKDDLGQPIQGEAVTFTVKNQSVSFTPPNATSDGSGRVVTTVQSGSTATSVRVTATLDSNTQLTTTSTAIAVATGPPDQNSISLSASVLNPRAWDVDGKEVVITAFLADRFNNPITDGTAISFTTELGSIEPSCTTTNGSCSVKWRSQNPRINSLAYDINTNPINGITTILATVEGEESFTDNNGDGVFSSGDTFTDLAEAFRDDNDDGIFDVGEYFVDFNLSGSLDPASTLYNGKGCLTNCDPVDAITVRKSIKLVMSEDTPVVLGLSYNSGTGLDSSSPPAFDTAVNNTINVTIGGATNGQILPSGSTITFKTTNGTIVSGANQSVGDGVGAADTYSVFITTDGTPSSDGFLTYEVTVGDGGGTVGFVPIAITD